MAAQREPIFQALFALLQGIGDFKLASRVFLSWDDVAASQLPALFLVKGNESQTITQGLPPMWRLRAWAIFYCSNDEGRLTPPSAQINELLTSLELALQRKPTEPPPAIAPTFLANPAGSWGTSLGGLCYGCQIAGEVLIYEGNIAGTAEANVPIEILTTA